MNVKNGVCVGVLIGLLKVCASTFNRDDGEPLFSNETRLMHH